MAIHKLSDQPDIIVSVDAYARYLPSCSYRVRDSQENAYNLSTQIQGKEGRQYPCDSGGEASATYHRRESTPSGDATVHVSQDPDSERLDG